MLNEIIDILIFKNLLIYLIDNSIKGLNLQESFINK